MVNPLVFILQKMSSKMSDHIPDVDAVHSCLYAFREKDPTVDGLIEKLGDADSKLSKSVDYDGELGHDLYLAEALVKKLKAKHADATQRRIAAKNEFDVVYAAALKKIAALSNA
jgi:hypothetical protein